MTRSSATPRATGVTVQEYTKKYKQAFLEDADALNIQHPEFLVNATDHIQEMAHFIEGLVEKGFAYRTDDGSYYFRIAKFPEYGKLSKKDFAGHERRRAGGRGRIRQGQRPRLRAVEGAETGRGACGKPRSAPAVRAGTSSARKCR